MIYQTRGQYLGLFAAFLLLAGCGGGVAVEADDAGSASTTPPTIWPPFEAVAVEEQPPLDDTLGTRVVWQIDWNGADDWQLTVLEAETLGDTSGLGDGRVEVHPLPGTTVVQRDGVWRWIGADDAPTEAATERGVLAPNEWLQPRYVPPDWEPIPTVDGWSINSVIVDPDCLEGLDCGSRWHVELDANGIPVSVRVWSGDDLVKDVRLTSINIVEN